MGWAKYFEDNVEICYERQATMQYQLRSREAEFNAIYPTMSIRVENSKKSLIHPKVKYENCYITCKDCGRRFMFSAKMQKYFDQMSWERPKRCKCCRNYRNTRYLMCSSY